MRGIIIPMPYPASYFRLSMFRQCRHRYKLHYVDGLAEEYRKPRPYLTMGEDVHGLLTTRDIRHAGLTAQNKDLGHSSLKWRQGVFSRPWVPYNLVTNGPRSTEMRV